MAKLERAEIERRLKSLDGWRLEGDAISKQYTFAGFPEAIAFVNRLAPEAEGAELGRESVESLGPDRLGSVERHDP